MRHTETVVVEASRLSEKTLHFGEISQRRGSNLTVFKVVDYLATKLISILFMLLS